MITIMFNATLIDDEDEVNTLTISDCNYVELINEEDVPTVEFYLVNSANTLRMTFEDIQYAINFMEFIFTVDKLDLRELVDNPHGDFGNCATYMYNPIQEYDEIIDDTLECIKEEFNDDALNNFNKAIFMSFIPNNKEDEDNKDDEDDDNEDNTIFRI